MGTVRVIFLAPNTEALDTLDEKIDNLVVQAQKNKVPVCYCLNKRKLVRKISTNTYISEHARSLILLNLIKGKAVQMNMKQSVVAVLDPNGATMELFRRIVALLS